MTEQSPELAAAVERVCDCSALKEYPEGWEVDQFNAALADALRLAAAEGAGVEHRSRCMSGCKDVDGYFMRCVRGGELDAELAAARAAIGAQR